jgi:predicted RNase H-like HicB family nuclease
MKNNNPIHSPDPIPSPERYAVNIKWSEENDGFVALVPALPGCLCVMPTEASALKEIRLLIRAFLEIRLEDGHPIPEPDGGDLEEVDALLPLLNLSKLARAAGMNRATLASGVRRANKKFAPSPAVARRLARRLVAA